VVAALEATLTLPDDLRLERPLPITRGAYLDRPVLGRKRLRRRAVAGVAGPTGRLLVRLVAEMIGQLRRHRPLHQPLGQLREHAAGADDLLLGASTGEQLIDHLIGKTIANRVRNLEPGDASRALRSPSGLAPQPAGAIDQLGRLGLGL